MKYMLLVILVGFVKCDNDYFVVQVPDDSLKDQDQDQGSDRQFNVYWNVPTKQCKSKRINFEHLYEKYGIRQNNADRFSGEEVTILYDPGLFPALLKNKSSGKTHFRNGGVPQEGDLELHLKAFGDILDAYIPDPDFNGVGIIDFELWRPIFRQNFGDLMPIKNMSVEIEKNLYWDPEKDIHKEARLRFEKAARTFMKTTLAFAKKMRPNALWGYYGFPYCFNMAKNTMVESCSEKVREENDRTHWLWSESTALYPSIYSSKHLTTSQLASLVRGRMKEAERVKRKGTVILPYFWFRYREGGFLSENDLYTVLDTLHKSDTAGFIIWGSSEDVNTVSKCKELRHYLENTLGPAISALTKPKIKLEDVQTTNSKSTQIINNQTHPKDFELYWKPPENCIPDINKFIEEELQRKGYKFTVDGIMKNVNYSVQIKVSFNSLIKISNNIENEKVSAASNSKKSPAEFPKQTSQKSRKLLKLKKLLQIQKLTEEILALEAEETTDLKVLSPEDLSADLATLGDHFKKEDVKDTLKPVPRESLLLKDTLSSVENSTTYILAKQSPALTTVSPIEISSVTKPPIIKIAEDADTTLVKNATSKINYDGEESTNNGLDTTINEEHSEIKLLVEQQVTTEVPNVESEKSINIDNVTSINDNLRKEKEEPASKPTEYVDLNDTSSLEITKESPVNKTAVLTRKSELIEAVTNVTESSSKTSTQDLGNKFENVTYSTEYSSTETTNNYESSYKTTNDGNLVTKLLLNQLTTDIPNLEITEKDVPEKLPQLKLSTDITLKYDLKESIDRTSQLVSTNIPQHSETFSTENSTTESLFAISNTLEPAFNKSSEDDLPKLLENQTPSTGLGTVYSENFSYDLKEKDIKMTLKPVLPEPLQLNVSGTEYLITDSIETSTPLPSTDGLSTEILSPTESSLVTSKENLEAMLLENDYSNTAYSTSESSQYYENADKTFDGEVLVMQLLKNKQVTADITNVDTAETIELKDLTQKSLTTEATLQDGMKKEDIPLVKLKTSETLISNDISSNIEPPSEILDTQTPSPTEIISGEIITNGTQPSFNNSEELVAKVLESQTAHTVYVDADTTQRYESADKIINEPSVVDLQENNSLVVLSEKISNEILSEESLQSHQESTLISVLDKTIDTKDVTQTSLNGDVSKQQKYLETKDIKLALMPVPESTKLKITLAGVESTTEILVKNIPISTESVVTKSTSEEIFTPQSKHTQQSITEIPTLGAAETDVLQDFKPMVLSTNDTEPQDVLKNNRNELKPLLSETVQSNDTLSSTEISTKESTHYYEISNKTYSGENKVTNLLQNQQFTTIIPVDSEHLKDYLKEDTKAETPKETTQLNYTPSVKESTIEPYTHEKSVPKVITPAIKVSQTLVEKPDNIEEIKPQVDLKNDNDQIKSEPEENLKYNKSALSASPYNEYKYMNPTDTKSENNGLKLLFDRDSILDKSESSEIRNLETDLDSTRSEVIDDFKYEVNKNEEINSTVASGTN